MFDDRINHNKKNVKIKHMRIFFIQCTVHAGRAGGICTFRCGFHLFIRYDFGTFVAPSFLYCA